MKEKNTNEILFKKMFENYRFFIDLYFNSKKIVKAFFINLDASLAIKKEHIDSVLRAKHNTNSKLSLINFSSLQIANVSLLKNWKENNFLIYLKVEDLFNNVNKLILKKIISLKIPILLVESKNYFKHNLGSGPLHLNVFFKLVAENNGINLSKLITLMQKGSLFYLVKNSSLFNDLRSTVLKNHDLNKFFEILLRKN